MTSVSVVTNASCRSRSASSPADSTRSTMTPIPRTTTVTGARSPRSTRPPALLDQPMRRGPRSDVAMASPTVATTSDTDVCTAISVARPIPLVLADSSA